MEKVVPRAVLQARPVLSVRLVLLLRVLPARLGAAGAVSGAGGAVWA